MNFGGGAKFLGFRNLGGKYGVNLKNSDEGMNEFLR